MSVTVIGEHEERTIQQLERCVRAEEGAAGVLCADGHVGYSQPVGGAVAYREHISVSGVGYDIGCGNKAVRTDLRREDIEADLPRIMDAIVERISFGVGRHNDEPVDHPVLDAIRSADAPAQRELADLAAKQLGTVGAGNHYVDLFADEEGVVWVGVHFGSRGFGHKTATRYLELAGRAAGRHGRAADPAARSTRARAGVHRGDDARVRLRLRGPRRGGRPRARDPRRLPHALRPQQPQLREPRDARRRGLVGRAQGLHARLPRPAGLRRLDDGRAERDPRGRRHAGGARAALLSRPSTAPGDGCRGPRRRGRRAGPA